MSVSDDQSVQSSVGDCTRPFCGGSVRSGRREFHSHIDSQDLNQNTSVGNLPL